MRESAFWRTVQKGLTDAAHELGSPIRLERIENKAAAGTADVSATFRGEEFWLELKVVRSNRITCERSQPGWHESYHRVDGRSFIVIRHGRRILIYRGHKLRALKGHVDTWPAPDAEFRPLYDWQGMLDWLLCCG